MLLSTGEDVPKGQSLRARLMLVEVPQIGTAFKVVSLVSTPEVV